MTAAWVDYLTGPWGFAFAFAAGVLSFLSPCVLPLVPAYMAHLTGAAVTLDPTRSERRETVTHAIAFVLGFGAVFTTLGASVGLLGATLGADNSYFLRDNQRLLSQIGGVFLIVMGLNLIGIIRIPFLYRTYTLDSATAHVPVGATAGGGTMAMGGRGGGGAPIPGLVYGKSLAVGAAFAIGWTPCIGPVLGAITTLAATSGDAARGTYLLMFYSLGLGVPFVLTAFAVTPITRFLRSIRGMMPLIEITMGVLVIFVGILLFFNEMALFNSYFSDIPGLDQFNNI